MDPSDGRPAVDERSLAALEALRAAPAGDPVGGVVVRGLVDRVLERWPVLTEGAWGARLVRTPVVAVVGAVVLLAVVAALVLHLGGGGGSGEPPSLPFTTTTVPAAGPGSTVGGPSGSAAAPPTTAAALVVHAAGAVVEPGVHRVPAGSRVADVLAAAGGPAPDADLDRVNLAAPVADGQRLYVPRRGEAGLPAVVGPTGPDAGGSPATGGSGGGAAAPSGPVNLNEATEAQLDALPGVGPATAAAIVEHRTRNGPFRSVEGLLEVRGIGPAKLDALRDLVTVG